MGKTGDNDLTLRERFAGPSGGEKKRPRRAAYAIPTFFTSANIFLGFIALVQSFEGALQASAGDSAASGHFSLAAKALGFAVLSDGIDGRVARMTNTTSDFGRELDSLADFITFGIAPGVLAFVWGVRYVVFSAAENVAQTHLSRAGYLVAFFYLLCCAVRLARFNVQTNPVPKNPGRTDRKYFVGMPSPAAAGLLASIVYFDSVPVHSFAFSIVWLILVGLVGLLMVSTWRYPSFKQVTVSKPRTPLIVLLIGAVAFGIWEWSQPFLLAAATTYALTGIVIRLGGILRRYRRGHQPASLPEHQIG